MKRIISITLISLALFFLLNDAGLASSGGDPQQENILSAAENLFVFMKNKNYKAVWSSLSKKTQTTYVNDVMKANKKENKENKNASLETNEDALFNDFFTGGYYAKAYWDSFLSVVNPDIFLERCSWEMGKIGKNEAEIILQYKTSEKPAILRMFKENNVWKVGLDETFGTRRLLPF